jgi:hypothetical protein
LKQFEIVSSEVRDSFSIRVGDDGIDLYQINVDPNNGLRWTLGKLGR